MKPTPMKFKLGLIQMSCGLGVDDNLQKALTLMEAPKWDAPLLAELSQAMADASICGLGQAAPNPVLTVLKYFPREVN